MEIFSWIINGLSLLGSIVNIKYRKEAVFIWTVATSLALVYFWQTNQMPFVYRFFIHLAIDIITLWNIFRNDKGK